MAAEHHPGGAVLLREVVECPHGVEHDRRVGERKRVHDVVLVEALSRLTGADVDPHRSAELVVRSEDLVEHAQHERVGGEAVEAPDLGEQRVDASSAEPFEVVPPRRGCLPERGQLGLQRLDLVGRDEALDHCCAAGSNRGGDVISRGVVPQARHSTSAGYEHHGLGVDVFHDGLNRKGVRIR